MTTANSATADGPAAATAAYFASLVLSLPWSPYWARPGERCHNIDSVKRVNHNLCVASIIILAGYMQQEPKNLYSPTNYGL